MYIFNLILILIPEFTVSPVREKPKAFPIDKKKKGKSLPFTLLSTYPIPIVLGVFVY